MNNIFFDKSKIKSEHILILLLILNFAFRLIIYFNTTLFYFSDYKAYLDGIERIHETGSIPLIIGNFYYLNSYIGYFFKYILGSIDYYFIFNALLATLTSLIVYLIVVRLTNNKKIGLITILLHTFYTEFITWSSIFYTPIIMMFLLSVIIYLILFYLDSHKNILSIIIAFSIIIIINFTYYFKGEMHYFWVLFLFFGFVNLKRKKIFLKFLLLGIILFGSTKILKSYHILPYKEGNVMANDFRFFGHTLYGGDGGDGSFVYKENEDRYNREFKAYCERNKIDDPSRTDRNNFQSEEIKKFVTQHPFQWVKLQFYKFFRFFGVVPEGSSFKILITGLFNSKIYLTAIFLVLPFSLMLLTIILFSDYKVIIRGLKNPKYQMLFLFVGYYIAGSVFYGQYQERYRMPVMVCFIIPFTAYSLIKRKWELFKKNKRIIMIKSAIILVILIIWFSQAYHALVIRKDRYIGTAHKTIEEFQSE